MDEQKKEMLAILREERQILINKTKSGTYIAMTVIIPSLITVYSFILNREPIVLPIVGSIVQGIIALIFYGIIAAGSLGLVCFVILNFLKYQDMEKRVDKLLSEDIKEDSADGHKDKKI